ncbi:hypothetical protein Vretifemale_3505 [Volvox reticuliferus]|uniref:Uncharacterized protein n=1 Tax=Volvox reticuliferus TaxID=1737510 RepID=A0A8J4FJG1_9CHLO|nr:hypothetical protein Vretifemale_3505 [Volvox reticuliferus]
MYRRAATIAGQLASRHVVSFLEPGLLSRVTMYAGPTYSASVCSTRPHATLQSGLRAFCTFDVQNEMNAVNELFAEAREEIEFAKEEAETVYFNESVQTARRAVEACMSRWEGLLAALPEAERNRVMRSMGLKIAQLQAEYDEVSKLHLED